MGAGVGWLLGMMMKKPGDGRIVMIENMLVGVFGAFVGGDFIVSMLNKGVVNDKDFHIGSLAMAIGGAVVMIVVLKLMRRIVGPMHVGKAKQRNNH